MSVKSGFRVTNDLDYYRQQIESATIIAGGLQPETQVWYNRIIKNGGTISNADIATTDILMYQLNQASYRSKILFLMPFMGNVIKASVVPLVDDKCFGIPVNTGTTPFVDADCGTAVGLKGQNAGVLVCSAMPTSLNSTTYLGGVGAYMRAVDVTGSTTEVVFTSNVSTGTFSGRYGLDLRTSGANTFFSYDDVANRTTSGPVATNNHHYYGQKSASNLRSLWDNGAASGTNGTATSTQPSGSINTTGFAILGASDSGTTSYIYNKSTVGCVYFTDGTLASGDISALHTLLTTYLITATGR